MRKTFTLVATVALCCASAFAAGKGASVAATNVFSGKLIESITENPGGEKSTFVYNTQSQLVSVNIGGEWTETVTFDYTGGADYDVKMEVVSAEENMVMYITLGENLFASSARQEINSKTDGNETVLWNFEYNNEGQLVKITQSSDDNVVSTITYADGDIVKVETDDEDFATEVSTISYTNAAENKSGIMLYDTTFCVDLDEIEIAYFAGLLGKPSKHLPDSSKDAEDEVEKYAWTVDANGYPTQLTVDYGYETDSLTFTWMDNTGVEDVVMDGKKRPEAYFTMQGVQVKNPDKGLYIVKNTDGTASKVLVK